MRTLHAVRFLLLLALWPAFASANVIGPGSQNFNSTTDGLDYVTVQSSKTLLPGILNVGVFVNDAVNTLPYIDSSTQTRVHVNDNLLGADINFGVGIMPRWDAGISLPFILDQWVHDSGDIHGQFTGYGNTEVRLNTKYRLLGEESGGLAAVGSVNINRIDNDPYSGIDAGPTYNLELVADTTVHEVSYSLNVGRRFRDPGSQVPGAPVAPLRDQWIYSGGVSYLVTRWDTKVIGEIFGSTPAESVSGNELRSLTSIEALAGIKHDVNTALAVHFGGGAGLDRGVSSPDWRVYAGLNYNMGPFWPHKVTVKESVVAPLVVVPQPPESKKEVFRANNLLFAFDSDEMAGDYQDQLKNLATYLHNNPFEKLVISGHTDSIGPREYNLDLSKRRAQSVANYLIHDLQFNADKIEANGFGPDKPIDNNGNYQGRQNNRRVEFEVTH